MSCDAQEVWSLNVSSCQQYPKAYSWVVNQSPILLRLQFPVEQGLVFSSDERAYKTAMVPRYWYTRPTVSSNICVQSCSFVPAGPRVKNSGAAAAATSSSSEPRQEYTHSEDVSDADIANLSDGEPVRSMYATARNSEEDAILLIMEFTGLGRPAAMDLLAEFGGNAQEALANLYH